MDKCEVEHEREREFQFELEKRFLRYDAYLTNNLSPSKENELAKVVDAKKDELFSKCGMDKFIKAKEAKECENSGNFNVFQHDREKSLALSQMISTDLNWRKCDASKTKQQYEEGVVNLTYKCTIQKDLLDLMTVPNVCPDIYGAQANKANKAPRKNLEGMKKDMNKEIIEMRDEVRHLTQVEEDRRKSGCKNVEEFMNMKKSALKEEILKLTNATKEQSKSIWAASESVANMRANISEKKKAIDHAINNKDIPSDDDTFKELESVAEEYKKVLESLCKEIELKDTLSKRANDEIDELSTRKNNQKFIDQQKAVFVKALLDEVQNQRTKKDIWCDHILMDYIARVRENSRYQKKLERVVKGMRVSYQKDSDTIKTLEHQLAQLRGANLKHAQVISRASQNAVNLAKELATRNGYKRIV